MEFNAKTAVAETDRSSCLIITVTQPQKLSKTGVAIDKASSGFLSTILKQGDMEGSIGQSLILHSVPGINSKRVLLIGCGKDSDFNERSFTSVVLAMTSALAQSGARDALLFPADINLKGRDSAWKARQACLLFANSEYKFDRLKSGKKSTHKGLSKLSVHTDKTDNLKISNAIEQAQAISAGMTAARDLGNLPGNICTPSYIAKQAKLLAVGSKNIKVTVLEEADMKRLKMGSLLSVSAGSRQPAKLITIEYRGAGAKEQPIALVGKGVTFDTGGISLKPGGGMDEMKFDMCGAASVIGTIEAVKRLALPINVVGVIPTTENMPDGIATKPGDIVTSMSGQTIEVLNTDAEGRLILCDALTYTRKFKPSCVIDIATLTGACIVALGKVPSAVLGNNKTLIADLIRSGQQIEDKLWELPLWDEYQEQLNSNFADMANIGGRDAGTITAACFLSRFTGDMKWAHLDIAGTAWHSGEKKGATGRPVPLLTQFILNQIKA
ncbi:MAG: leucyl aminopeptidase [Planctomycetota bacterium]|jgi:leucyl aminopeptidase